MKPPRTFPKNPWILLYTLVVVVAVHLLFLANQTGGKMLLRGRHGEDRWHDEGEVLYFDALAGWTINFIYLAYFILAILAVRMLQVRHSQKDL